MKIIEIRNLEKKDSHLHYRNEFTGEAVCELPFETRQSKEVEFTLERSATGNLDISVRILEDIDYPLIPVIRSLKSYIFELEKQGKLL
jgi:hypothetical protein